ncbi:MAG: hypothetical protein ACTSYA_04880 [Candidatus Kariarchaeaceae archaeon]
MQSKNQVEVSYTTPPIRNFEPLDGLYHGTRIVVSQVTGLIAAIVWFLIFCIHSSETNSLFTTLFMVIALGTREAALQVGRRLAYRPPLLLMRTDNYDKIMSWGGLLALSFLQMFSSFFGFPGASSLLGVFSFWMSFIWSDFVFLAIISVKHKWSPIKLFRSVFRYSFTSSGMDEYELKLAEVVKEVQTYVYQLQRYTEEVYDPSWKKKMTKWYRSKVRYEQMLTIANSKGRRVFFLLARLPYMEINMSAISILAKITEDEAIEIINAFDYLKITRDLGSWDHEETTFQSYGKDPSRMQLPVVMAFLVTILISFSILEAIPNTSMIMYFIFASLVSAISALWAEELRLF